VEEKIKIEPKSAKSPALAGILSVIFPGTGALYNGNYLKGIVLIIILPDWSPFREEAVSHLSLCY